MELASMQMREKWNLIGNATVTLCFMHNTKTHAHTKTSLSKCLHPMILIYLSFKFTFTTFSHHIMNIEYIVMMLITHFLHICRHIISNCKKKKKLIICFYHGPFILKSYVPNPNWAGEHFSGWLNKEWNPWKIILAPIYSESIEK